MRRYVSSLWRSCLAGRAETFRLFRPVFRVSDYGQALAESETLGEIRGVLTPFRMRKTMTERLSEDVADALFFTEEELLVGDILERDGERWEVLSLAYWPDQALNVAEVRHVRGA